MERRRKFAIILSLVPEEDEKEKRVCTTRQRWGKYYFEIQNTRYKIPNTVFYLVFCDNHKLEAFCICILS
jgi:hypothetical protein